MLGSSWLRVVIAKYGLLRYLLLVAQLVIVITSFSVAVECKAATLTHPDLCLSHMGNYGEHEHSHSQSVAILPLTIGLAASLLMLSYVLPTRLPTSTLLNIIKPPPRFA